MLTAEYGGSGGKSIEGGMVVEEPDIEIGQGVSSKAISRRMQTDKGGHNGPKSSRDREEEDSRYRRDRNEGRRDDDRNDRAASYANPPGVPQAIPGFFPNGMPMFPPGFVFPGQNQHPPPPGHRT
jgi:protein NRD1